MKTVLSKIADCLEKDIKFITKDCDQSDRYYQAGMMYALTLVRDNFNEEKEQIIDAYIEGYSAPENRGDSEKYFNETFKL